MRKVTQERTNTFVTIAAFALLLIMLSASSQSFGSGTNSASNYQQYDNSVLLSVSSGVIQNGSAFEVQLGIDFTDILMGGSIALDYDATALEFVSFTFTEGGPEPILADFTQSPFGAFVSWGWFQYEPDYGVLGLRSIGTLTLIARTLGVTSIVSSAVANGTAAGPLVGPGSPGTPLVGTPLQVNYGQTSFYVVPEPSSAGLLLLGLLLLARLGQAGSEDRS
jgi:hypothetical protein